MLAVTPSFLRAAFLNAGMFTAELGDAKCCAAPQLSRLSADEVISSSSHEKRGVTASLLGFPSAAEWERTVLSSLPFSSCSWREGPMQDLAAGVVRNERRPGVFSFTAAYPKPVLLSFSGLGETAVHRDLPRVLGLALKVKQQGVHDSTLRGQGEGVGVGGREEEG